MSMSIGQLAKQANVSNRTVRYYEELGLIVPKNRGSNRYRYYDDSHLSRLNLVKMLQESGFALKEIVSALNPMLDPQGNITYSGQEMARNIHQSLQEHRDRLIQKQRELIKSIAAIDSTLEELRECFACTRGHDLTQCASCATGPSSVISLGRHVEQRAAHGEQQ